MSVFANVWMELHKAIWCLNWRVHNGKDVEQKRFRNDQENQQRNSQEGGTSKCWGHCHSFYRTIGRRMYYMYEEKPSLHLHHLQTMLRRSDLTLNDWLRLWTAREYGPKERFIQTSARCQHIKMQMERQFPKACSPCPLTYLSSFCAALLRWAVMIPHVWRTQTSYLAIFSNRCSNMRQYLDTYVRTSVDSQQTERSMLMCQFWLFVDPNVKSYVEAAAALNQGWIGCVIDNIQKVFFPEKRPATSTKGLLSMNVPGKSEVIFGDDDGRNASGRPVWNRTKM